MKRWLQTGTALIMLCTSATATVRLPAVLSDNVVLQSGQPVRVWGWSNPGEAVTISIGNQVVKGKADACGRWRLMLEPMQPTAEPLTLTVKGAGNETTVTNILVGEVWLGSGQSNMEMALANTAKAKEFIAQADHPNIRLFKIWRGHAAVPRADCAAEWTLCTPETARSFSAALYHMGKRLHEALGVPVGLIQSPYSGTSISGWIPAEGLGDVSDSLARSAENAAKRQAQCRQELLAGLDGLEAWLNTTRLAAKLGEPVYAPVLTGIEGTGMSSLYNYHIHPMTFFTIRGVAWYQGEANVSGTRGLSYFEAMKALIQGWRNAWDQGDFPFYFVQIAPRQYVGRYCKSPYQLPLLWENQVEALRMPNTGMAGTMDISPAESDRPEEAHPRNKHDVGKRLALCALAKTYGKTDLVYSGPMYASHDVQESAIRIRFKHVGSGLATRDGEPPDWFTIAGEDQEFVDARAEIDGDAVMVRAPGVPQPVAVRFGWHELAVPNLMNKEGLPAIPFRTDRW